MRVETRHPGRDFALTVKTIASGRLKDSNYNAHAVMGELPHRVFHALNPAHLAIQKIERHYLKAAVGAISTSGGAGEAMVSMDAIARDFYESLSSQSIFFGLLAAGMPQPPEFTRLAIVTAEATGWIVGEGKPVPISGINMTEMPTDPIEAAALIVASDKVWNSKSPKATNLIESELRKAVVHQVDKKALSILFDTSTPTFNGAGSDEAAVRSDFAQVLNAVNGKAAGSLIAATTPALANQLTFYPDPRAEMTPVGGKMFGIPIIASDVVDEGTFQLFNAAELIGDVAAAEIKISSEAALEMRDNPTQDASVGAAANLLSLWQTNATAMMVTIPFIIDRMRGTPVAKIENVAWSLGQPVSG